MIEQDSRRNTRDSGRFLCKKAYYITCKSFPVDGGNGSGSSGYESENE